MSVTSRNRPPPAMAELYEADFYAWTQAQADALRRLAAGETKAPVDPDRLAEEIEDVGRAQRAAVRSQLARIIEHCLKLEWSPASEPRGGWRASVIDARDTLKDQLTPSLRRELVADLDEIHLRGRRRADNGLRDAGEHAAADALPTTCPYTLDQLLQDDWYPASRHGIGSGGA